jgi:phage tail sheath protein FI
MPEYLAPGVYVEERDTGAKAIEGVSTTTSGMVGVTERGPLGVPTLVIGTADFRRQFGGYLDRRVYTGETWYLPHAIEGFFTNGGKRLYIVRVLPDKAATAEAMLFDRGAAGGASADLAAPAHVGDESLLLTSNAGIAVGGWLKLQDGNATEYVQVASTNAAAMSIRGRFASNHNIGRNVTIVTVVLGVPGALAGPTAAGVTQITTAAALAVAPGDVIQIGTLAGREYAIVSSAVGTTINLRYALSLTHAAAEAVAIATVTLGAVTTLTAPISTGDRLFTVMDGTIAGFATDAIVLFSGPTAAGDEYHVIEPVVGVRFTNSAAQLHATGSATRVVTTIAGTARVLALAAAAGATTVTLDTTTGLAAGQFLEIGTGATLEIAEVSSVNQAASLVTLRDALAFAHLLAETAPDVTFNLVAASVSDAAVRIGPGDNLLLVQSAPLLAGYVPNAIVEISGSTAAQLEYRQILAVPTITAIVTGIPAIGANPAVPVPITAMHLAETVVLGRSPLLTVDAIDPGVWGDSLYVTAEDDDPILDTTAAAGNIGDPTLALRTSVGVEPGTILEIGYVRNLDGSITAGTLQKVATVNGNRVGFTGGLVVNVANGARVRTREFMLTVELLQMNPNTGKLRIIENQVHRQLSMDPRHSRYVTTVVGPIFRTDATTPRRADGRTHGESDLIRVQDILADPLTGALTGPALITAQTSIRLGPDLNTQTRPDGRVIPVATVLAGGDDQIGTVTDDTYIGLDDLNPENRTGLFALKNIDEISIVSIPGRTHQKVQQALVDHCELLRYRFGVLDAGRAEGMAEVQEHRSLYDSKYAAIYHPWLVIDDPFPDNPRTGGEILIPPAGHMMGIYARSDIERGVHKAPANEVIRGINDLAAKLMKEEQDILNPRNINVLRNFREANRGLRVWGARTISSDPDWKYINVRRLFIYIEHSIDRGTQWVVFEPNSEPLWQRVRRVVMSFLFGVWRDGALMGQKPEEAYYVKCDRTTMSQSDIDNGRLIVEIGIAPVKPAEFVIFRIGQWSGGSSVDEG